MFRGKKLSRSLLGRVLWNVLHVVVGPWFTAPVGGPNAGQVLQRGQTDNSLVCAFLRLKMFEGSFLARVQLIHFGLLVLQCPCSCC